MDFIQPYLRALVPMFVAVDALGLVPLYVGLTEGIDKPHRQTILQQAVLTALAVAVGFMLVGNLLFEYMGIQADDFKIAGGLLLLVISTIDLLAGVQLTRKFSESPGAVPLGTPLIAGPAVLATSLISLDTYGFAATLVSLVINIVLVGVVLRSSDLLIRVIGSAGSRAFSKVANLILAAFAVMMIRKGIEAFLR